MEKLTLEEVKDLMYKFNEENGNNYNGGSNNKKLNAVIVLKQEFFKIPNLTLEQRSYKFSNENKAFYSGLGGYSIFAWCSDGDCVRIEHLPSKYVEYCYIVE